LKGVEWWNEVRSVKNKACPKEGERIRDLYSNNKVVKTAGGGSQLQ
jgi:hypothetical protein